MQCTFTNNTASTKAGAVYVCSTSSLTFTNCTFAYNTSPSGAALYCASSSALDNCIVAFNGPGEGIFCAGLAPTCTDIYGNLGGDWIGCLEGQAGENGNLSADPLFCNAPARDLTINAVSPCNAGTCGLIGAWPVGCPAAEVEDAWEQGREGEAISGADARPNPMRRDCRIVFAGPGGRVSLEVVSPSGRVVRRLLDGEHSAGTIECLWDGRDDGGRPVASGVYLASIRTAARNRSLRLVLLR